MQKVEMFKSDDGELFESEEAAKNHETSGNIIKELKELTKAIGRPELSYVIDANVEYLVGAIKIFNKYGIR